MQVPPHPQLECDHNTSILISHLNMRRKCPIRSHGLSGKGKWKFLREKAESLLWPTRHYDRRRLLSLASSSERAGSSAALRMLTGISTNRKISTCRKIIEGCMVNWWVTQQQYNPAVLAKYGNLSLFIAHSLPTFSLSTSRRLSGFSDGRLCHHLRCADS